MPAPRSLSDLGRLTSENRPQRGQFLPDLQAHSPAMGQKDGKKWIAAVDLQPTIPKTDRLLDIKGGISGSRCHLATTNVKICLYKSNNVYL